MAATNAELLDRYFQEVGRDDPHWLTVSSHHTVDRESGTLFWRRTRALSAAEGFPEIPRTAMAVFSGHRFKNGTLILNGDGFDDRRMQQMQADLRERARIAFGQPRVALIPFQALDGAQIQRNTIRPIQITEDTNINRLQPVQLGSLNSAVNYDQARYGREWAQWRRDNSFPEDGMWSLVSNNIDQRDETWEGRYEGARFSVRFARANRSDSWTLHSANIWAQPENGMHAWQQIRWQEQAWLEDRGEAGEYYTGWAWTERVHMLGAVVFTAITDVDGRRHRYLSAFDMQEPAGLYFLAMLPDRGECKTYGEAIDLLAPEMVKRMREQGRQVYRQGDVFAVETTMTDEQVYEGAITRVRRDIVIQNADELLSRGLRPLKPAKGEVTEKGTCPMCDCKPSIGNGPLAREALSIHRTGHTADEVVVKEGGVTFVRGRMFHDPWIEDPTRAEPDHRPIPVGPEVATAIARTPASGVLSELPTFKWYVAIRNAVPQLRPRTTQIVENDTRALQEHRQVEQGLEEQRASEARLTVRNERARDLATAR